MAPHGAPRLGKILAGLNWGSGRSGTLSRVLSDKSRVNPTPFLMEI